MKAEVQLSEPTRQKVHTNMAETKPLQVGQPTSNIPILGEGFQENSPSRSHSSDNEPETADRTSEGVKSGKRRFFGLGKRIKKDDNKEQKKSGSQKSTTAHDTTKVPASSNVSSSQSSPRIRATHPYQQPTSPGRGGRYSSSPRIISPAGSQIFERDVQESSIPAPNSPAIPSHIQNENRIPPVLDASSEAITNSHLDPDSVEIVTHTSHMPAASTVAANSEASASLFSEDSLAHPDKEEVASNYGTLDSADIRRLSFISFADVVQSEQAEHSAGNRDSMYVAGLTSLVDRVNRSPSPVRSPVSSVGFGTSPPTSGSASPKVTESSPSRMGRSLGSPMLSYPSPPGELTIETMGQAMQALKKTGNSDTATRSPLPLSPISSTDGIPR